MWIFIYSARPATTKTQAKDKGKKLTEKCKGKLCEELARNTRLTILSMLMLHSTIILRMQHAPMCCIHQHVYVHLSLSCHDRTYALNYVYGIPLVVTAKWHPQPVTNIKKIKTIYWFLMRERARAGSPNSSSLIPFDYSALDATAGFAVYFSCFLGMQLPSSSVIFSYPNHMSCVPPIYSHCACKSVGCWCWLLLLFCFFFHFGSLFFPVCKF